MRQIQQAAVCLITAFLGQVAPTPLSENQPKLHATLKGHAGAIICLRFSADGKTLASASKDCTIRLWEVATNTEMKAIEMEHTEYLLSAAFSPDCKTVASATMDLSVSGSSPDVAVTLWNSATGKKRFTLKQKSPSLALTFSPDGEVLASGSNDGTIRLFDVTTGREQASLTGHTDWVRSVIYSPDGKTIASVGNDGMVRLWDVPTRKKTATLTTNDNVVTNVAFSPDGKILAFDSRFSIDLWDAAKLQKTATLADPVSITCVAFSPDGRSLATGSRAKKISFWSLASRCKTATLADNPQSITSLAFSPNGKLLAAGDGASKPNRPGAITIWSLASIAQSEK